MLLIPTVAINIRAGSLNTNLINAKLIVLFRLLLVALTFAFASNFSCTATFAKQDELQKALVMRQSGDLIGATKTTVTPKALRIDIEESSAYIVAKAPNWEVMFCNDANKRVLKMNLADWLKHVPEMNYSGIDWDRYNIAIKPARSVVILGRPAKLYKVVGKHLTKGIISPTDRVTNGTYVELQNPFVPVEAAHIMQKSIGAPQSNGAPLEFDKVVEKLNVFNTIPGKERFLHTRRIEEKEVSTQLFIYPNNYKAVKREVEVLDDPKRRKMVDGAVDLFWDGARK